MSTRRRKHPKAGHPAASTHDSSLIPPSKPTKDKLTPPNSVITSPIRPRKSGRFSQEKITTTIVEPPENVLPPSSSPLSTPPSPSLPPLVSPCPTPSSSVHNIPSPPPRRKKRCILLFFLLGILVGTLFVSQSLSRKLISNELDLRLLELFSPELKEQFINFFSNNVFTSLWENEPKPWDLLLPPPHLASAPQAGNIAPEIAATQGYQRYKHSVVLIPGFISTGLEVWASRTCAKKYTRQRIWGSITMLQSFLLDTDCWMNHLRLNPITGRDPKDIRLRPALGFEAADFFLSNYWIWGKIIESLAYVGLDSSSMYFSSYDWRLSPANVERRDGYFSRLAHEIELMNRDRMGGGEADGERRKSVLIGHSMASNTMMYFLKWVESPRGGKRGKTWVKDNIESIIFIAGAFAGVPKAITALLSGEMKDTADFGIIDSPYFFDLFGSSKRRWLFRTWQSLGSLLPRGGDKIWGSKRGGVENKVASTSKTSSLSPVSPLSPTENFGLFIHLSQEFQNEYECTLALLACLKGTEEESSLCICPRTNKEIAGDYEEELWRIMAILEAADTQPEVCLKSKLKRDVCLPADEKEEKKEGEEEEEGEEGGEEKERKKEVEKKPEEIEAEKEKRRVCEEERNAAVDVCQKKIDGYESIPRWTVDESLRVLKKDLGKYRSKKLEDNFYLGVADEDVLRNEEKYDRPQYFSNVFTAPLPFAPEMKIYSFYGVGLPTERTYMYQRVVNSSFGVPSELDESVLEHFKTEKESDDLDYALHKDTKALIEAIDKESNSPPPMILDKRDAKNGINYVEGDATVPLLSLGVATRYLWKGQTKFNPANIKTVTREYPDNREESFVIDLRGRGQSADHVDILGNSNMIKDILMVVCGRGNELEDDIKSNVDDIVQKLDLDVKLSSEDLKFIKKRYPEYQDK